MRDLLVPGAAGLLPLRVYHPDPGRSLPLVVYLHGGGWVLGDVQAADRPCRRLALEGDCVVASLEYRRAPETRFPGPLEDCVTEENMTGAETAELGLVNRAVPRDEVEGVARRHRTRLARPAGRPVLAQGHEPLVRDLASGRCSRVRPSSTRRASRTLRRSHGCTPWRSNSATSRTTSGCAGAVTCREG